jgi:alpha-L-rhamnosidase
MQIANAIDVSGEGNISFENFEIYGFKYYAVFVVSGEIEIKDIYKIKIRHDPENAPELVTDDKELLEIYEASLESYRSNSLGIFTDCPTRERAGWLCDSYYMSRGSYAIMGNTLIEDDFLENFRNHGCKTIPSGMLPMCYPSEHPSGRFIPQWSLWFILELPEYKERNPLADLSLFRDTVDGILKFFEQYENEYYFLEDLPSWNFVEWSKANDWCEGVNFPTNMLYAAALKTAASLYGDGALSERADEIIAEVRRLSLRKEPVSGKVFFADRALRQNGEIVVTDDFTEVCQYYAFYFGAASPETDSELWRTLVEEFGPHRVKEGGYPGVHAANAFTGNYIRLDLLYENGLRDQVLRETDGYYSEMVKQTGTLWENNVSFRNASCNHGFASHVCRWLLNA